MATISMQITGLNARATKTISAQLATRMLAAFRVLYGKKPDGSDRSDQELFDFVADVYFARMKEDIRNIEGDNANKAVTPIDI